MKRDPPMQDDETFLQAIRNNPADNCLRLAYADWLHERQEILRLRVLQSTCDDPSSRPVYADCIEEHQHRRDTRAEFLRLRIVLNMLAPDHQLRDSLEADLSRLRKPIGVEPEAAHPLDSEFSLWPCECFDDDHRLRASPPLDFHRDTQDTECDAWKRLLELVDQAAHDGRSRFEPLRDMEWHDWVQIVTLPRTISKLKSVKQLSVCASHLVRIPPEIGDMTSLEHFSSYISRRLHWFPFEIVRCKNLKSVAVSTPALYGNYNHRPPFPQVHPETAGARNDRLQQLLSKYAGTPMVRPCSICNRPFEDLRLHRVWISLRVATDVLPLLVNACSAECLEWLPPGADGYVPVAHKGGLEVRQPAPYESY